MTRLGGVVVAATTVALAAAGMARAAPLPEVPYHLTARPWTPLETPREAYLDRVEGIVRYLAGLQDAGGAIVDPVAGREWQYATPYFADGVAVLLENGRAHDLLPHGVRAMEQMTQQLGRGNWAVHQQHGNFVLAPAAEALGLYAPFVSRELRAAWAGRLRRPIEHLIRLHPTNWRTYAMKGEWYRHRQGLVSHADAVAFVERGWTETQRSRFSPVGDLYRDLTSDPDTFAYDAASRANLWTMLTAGYDGPSAAEIRRFVVGGTRSSTLLSDPTGQAPVGGRSGLHTWNDVYTGLGFELLAEEAHAAGDEHRAGQYRRAAMLAQRGVDRWRTDAGYYSVTKNRFDPALRVRYADYSQLTNYNGNVLLHMTEAWRARRSAIPEAPAPSEIGGYALALDDGFATAVANAGGMQLQANLRGSTQQEFTQYWNALGIVRFSRRDWDSRLGPSDGVRDAVSSAGVSFAPTFADGASWTEMASAGRRFRATFTSTFVHPLLVRARIDYRPAEGHRGPRFSDELVITPDGVLSTVTSPDAEPGRFGVTWPVLVHDGAPLAPRYTSHVASVTYPGGGDEQSFIALHDAPVITTGRARLRSSYGDLDPVRVTTPESAVQTFVYPRNGWDPAAEEVRTSFRRTGDGFSTVLGRVQGSSYVGRTAAGGVGSALDLDGDGTDEVTFGAPVGFVVQHADGRITAIEADRTATATVQGRVVELEPHAPVRLTDSSDVALEAEAGLLHGAARRQACAPCAGRRRVGFLGTAGGVTGSLELRDVRVPVSGAYRLTLSYTNADTAPREATVTVNGINTAVAFQPTGGWDTVARRSVTVELRAGTNTIAIGGSARGPSLDRLALELAMEAESGALTGGAAVEPCASCSGGARVGHLGRQPGSAAGTLELQVEAPATGTYVLTLHFSNADSRQRTATVSVNGRPGAPLSFAATGGWETSAPLDVPVRLHAGRNTVVVGNPTARAPSLDRVVLHVP